MSWSQTLGSIHAVKPVFTQFYNPNFDVLQPLSRQVKKANLNCYRTIIHSETTAGADQKRLGKPAVQATDILAIHFFLTARAETADRQQFPFSFYESFSLGKILKFLALKLGSSKSCRVMHNLQCPYSAIYSAHNCPPPPPTSSLFPPETSTFTPPKSVIFLPPDI